MPQTWLVVRCHQCQAFQVDQEKKAKKWSCKLCGEKQSLQRVYARSHSAKDCRLVVQGYNEARGAAELEAADAALERAYAAEEGGWEEGDGWEEQDAGHGSGGAAEPPAHPQRWLAFQEEGDEGDEGWTLAAPERPAAARKKRGGGQGGDGGGTKRQRQQQQQQQAEDEEGGWGPLAGTGGAAGWQQKCPLGSVNGQPQLAAAQGRGWQGGPQQPHCAPTTGWQQRQEQQPQRGPAVHRPPAPPQQRTYQPPPQQQHMVQQQPWHHQQQQQQQQQQPTFPAGWQGGPPQQAKAPAAGGWGRGGHSGGAPPPHAVQQQQQQQQQPAAAGKKWGTFVDADEDW